MNQSCENLPTGERRHPVVYLSIAAAISVASILAAYLVAGIEADGAQKTRILAALVGGYLLVCAALYLLHARHHGRESSNGEDVLEQLFDSIDEAGRMFSGSLGRGDTLRLITSRLRDSIQINGALLFQRGSENNSLAIVAEDGQIESGLAVRLAGRTAKSRMVGRLVPIASSAKMIAIPLVDKADVVAVLCLQIARDEDISDTACETIASRIGPMVEAAFAFERTQFNALTDTTTNLPNERAFYLVLEKQLAESQRRPAERPLTLLVIDIKDFDSINLAYGHATGDRVLNYVADTVKDTLRQMDFIARTTDDEFLAIMPTATKEVSHDVMGRLHTAFFGRKLKVSDTNAIEIELNFGWAAYGEDGETPQALITTARLRKEQAKGQSTPNVLWFPRETASGPEA